MNYDKNKLRSLRSQFVKTRNRLLKKNYPSVVTILIKKYIKNGNLPEYFLNFLKERQDSKINIKRARSRFKGNYHVRNFVWSRDKRKCRRCRSGINDLEIHHIRPIQTHPQLAIDSNNMLLVCRPCHRILELLSPSLQMRNVRAMM